MSEGETEIIRRLDALIRLSALSLFDEKSQKERIAILDMAGLTPKEIADILRTTPNSVSVALSIMRKEREKDKSSKQGKRTVEPISQEPANE